MKVLTLTASFVTVASIILSIRIAAQTDTDKTFLKDGVTARTMHGQIITTAIHGQIITTAINSYVSPSNVTTFHVIPPFNLVYLAYQGNLTSQGIPGGKNLISQHQKGNLNAKDLVKAAINANKLPDEFLQEQSYLSAVNIQLTSLQNTFLR